ncbi:TetR family transcriptional regulator [cyanobacterium TDX16]|nr:TetR family transcriptional regulator [cyanobacterium TDX16]
MTDRSCLSSKGGESPTKSMRRLPKQQRGRQRVEKILDAAAEVFAEVGYEAATTHAIATRANTAVGSLYQFFPDKAAIFRALEIRHVARVRAMWDKVNTPSIIQLPLRQMIQRLVAAVAKLFEQPTSRVVFVQFFTAPEIFQTIDESLTQEAIAFMASLLKQRHPTLSDEQCSLLAEVCVHCSNTLILIALRSSETHSQQLIEQIEDLLVSYLSPHVGDELLQDRVMKVMKCPHCQSERLSKNGHRHGKQRYLCKDCGKQFPAWKG